MRTNDFAGLWFRAFLAGNEWYANTAGHEGHYASAFYSWFAAAGAARRRARCSDLVLLHGGSVCLVADGKPAGRALAQIRERGYADKYRGRPVHLIGIEFGREERNIVDFRFETV